MGERLFNGAGKRIVSSLLILVFCWLPAGCSKDEKKVEEVANKDASVAKAVDSSTTLAAPLSPYDMLKSLPKPPNNLLAEPGTTLKALKARKGVRPSSYSSRWLVAMNPSPEFKMIHFQLNKEQTHVETIVATLHPAYAVKERRDALIEVASKKLGKGKALEKKKEKVGRIWSLIDYAVQIRTDQTDKSVELVFSRRGRFDPTAPSTP
ncbi:MAG: hypothetical protein VYA30_05475 [Myxococcota bacterium]|nr:hypothetical protein [Myxococcota bacterium]